MPDIEDLVARLDTLEMRSAHADRVIEDLNAVIADQWKQIERLRRRLDQIDDQVAAVEHMARSGSKEPPPPHY